MILPIRQDLTIIIAAAGSGERLGLGAKALLTIEGQSLLFWLSRKALKVAAKVIVAVPPNKNGLHVRWAQHCPECSLIEGAESHLGTVAKLAQAAQLPWVMNLNVSLPFVSVAMMHAVAEAAKVHGIAGAFLPLNLPVAQITDGCINTFLSSRQAVLSQGPNAYLRAHLLNLIARADDQDWARQSFLEIAAHHNFKIGAVHGEETNIKISTQQDWVYAQFLARQNKAILQ